MTYVCFLQILFPSGLWASIIKKNIGILVYDIANPKTQPTNRPAKQPSNQATKFTICLGSTPTFLYFNLYLNTAYAVHYVYFTKWPKCMTESIITIFLDTILEFGQILPACVRGHMNWCGCHTPCIWNTVCHKVHKRNFLLSVSDFLLLLFLCLGLST